MSGLDPITFQVITSAISGIVQEMQNVVHRTGFSTIIRESQDTSSAITDREGRVVGQHGLIPLHMGAFPACVEAVLRNYPEDRIEEGDAFVTNHPYFGGSPHASDMGVMTPIFHRGELVGFCCSMAHKSDIGGTVPGSGSGQATEIFQEGIHLPPVKYVSRYALVREVEEILKANSRTPELVVGDLRGQIGTNRLGEKRMQALMDKYGRDRVLASCGELFDKTEQRVRRAVASWPDGVYESQGFLDNDGVDLARRVRLHLRVHKQGDRILFDFSGSDPQTRGPVNIRPPLVRAACYYAMVCMIDPTLPNNHGLARVVETKFAEGSVLNPALPAPVNSYIAAAQMAAELALKALSRMVPARSIAESGGDGALILGGRGTKTGRSYVQYEILGTAMGARRGKDGVSGVDIHMANCKVTSVEILEAEFPIRLRCFELIRDSGGSGEFRGGLSYVREYEILEGEGRFSMRGDKHVVQAQGILGGKPGRVGACIVNPGQSQEARLPSRFGDYRLKPGDVFRIERAGGGGFGDPGRRDPGRVLGDVLNGYVSPESAEADYGVAVDLVARRVDGAKTEKLRASKRADAAP